MKVDIDKHWIAILMVLIPMIIFTYHHTTVAIYFISYVMFVVGAWILVSNQIKKKDE